MTPLSISVFIRSMNYALPSLSVAFGVLPATSRNSYIDKVGMSVCNHAFLNVNVSVDPRLNVIPSMFVYVHVRRQNCTLT